MRLRILLYLRTSALALPIASTTHANSLVATPTLRSPYYSFTHILCRKYGFAFFIITPTCSLMSKLLVSGCVII